MMNDSYFMYEWFRDSYVSMLFRPSFIQYWVTPFLIHLKIFGISLLRNRPLSVNERYLGKANFSTYIWAIKSNLEAGVGLISIHCIWVNMHLFVTCGSVCFVLRLDNILLTATYICHSVVFQSTKNFLAMTFYSVKSN